jgi:hypothetical protein
MPDYSSMAKALVSEPKTIANINLRNELFPGEKEYFQKNPHVGGMAAEDDQIIMNPYSKLSDAEKQSVMLNEAARVHMRSGKIQSPQFTLTPEQESAFSSYGNNLNDKQSTIAARILSGDPSALNATPEQNEYVQQLKKFMQLK